MRDIRGLAEGYPEELVRRTVDRPGEGALVKSDRRWRTLLDVGGDGESDRGEDGEEGDRVEGHHLEEFEATAEGRARGREGPAEDAQASWRFMGPMA